MLPEQLPSPLIKSTWVNFSEQPNPKVLAAYELAAKSPGWNPKIVPLGNNIVAIDYCGNVGGKGIHSYNTVVFEDHPFLEELSSLKYVPKVVKHIYRKDIRLAHYRATSAEWVMSDLYKAQDAWETWLRDVGE